MKMSITGAYAEIVKEDPLMEFPNTTYRLECAFDGSWSGVSKTAIFRAGSVLAEAELVDDKCTIPPKCFKQGGIPLRIYIRGDSITTNSCQTSPILYNIVSRSAEQRRLYNEFIEALSKIPDFSLDGKSLTEILDEIEESAGITATDEEVGALLDDVWGPEGS